MEFQVRRPLPARIIVAIFVVAIWALIVGGFVRALVRHDAVDAAPALFIAFFLAGALLLRSANESLVASAEALVVRNVWRSYRIPVDTILGFETGPSIYTRWPLHNLQHTVHVVATGRSVPIDVMRESWAGPENLAGKIQQMQAWLAAAHVKNGTAPF